MSLEVAGFFRSGKIFTAGICGKNARISGNVSGNVVASFSNRQDLKKRGKNSKIIE